MKNSYLRGFNYKDVRMLKLKSKLRQRFFFNQRTFVISQANFQLYSFFGRVVNWGNTRQKPMSFQNKNISIRFLNMKAVLP